MPANQDIGRETLLGCCSHSELVTDESTIRKLIEIKVDSLFQKSFNVNARTKAVTQNHFTFLHNIVKWYLHKRQ